MQIEIDTSELTALAQHLLTKTPRQAVAAGRKATASEIRAVKSRAQAAAPRARPWLATSGIRAKVFTNADNVAGNVFTVPDPKGRPVGFFVEYGTSMTAPQPFMLPALTPAEQSYPAAIVDAVDPFAEPGAADVPGVE